MEEQLVVVVVVAVVVVVVVVVAVVLLTMAVLRKQNTSLGLLLALGLVLASQLTQTTEANGAGITYLIKGRPLQSNVEAIKQLRRFLPVEMSPEKRCERQAVLLNTFAGHQLNHFQVANIALADDEAVRQRLRKIDVETLRNLYMEAILSFKEAQQVSSAFSELVQCLASKFQRIDAKARAFLNEPELKTVLGQYEKLAKQPLGLLLADQQVHRPAELDGLGELHPAVKRTLSELFSGNQAPIERLVEGAKQVATAEKQVAPEEEEQEPLVESVPEPEAEPKQASRKGDQNEEEDELSESEQRYFDRVVESLVETYNTLPIESKLGDRCSAYNQVMMASESEIFKDYFVEQLVSGVAKRLAELGPGQEAFVPEKLTRDVFLVTVRVFDPQQAGAETWVDLVDCVSQWQETDQEVREFLNSPEHAKTIERLLAAPVEELNGQVTAATAEIVAPAEGAQSAPVAQP